MKNISAFTLSEVLITLGVIGIVAAMTLPSLIGRWQEKVTVAKLEHAYSLLSQAYVKAIGEDDQVLFNTRRCLSASGGLARLVTTSRMVASMFSSYLTHGTRRFSRAP